MFVIVNLKVTVTVIGWFLSVVGEVIFGCCWFYCFFTSVSSDFIKNSSKLCLYELLQTLPVLKGL